LTYGPERVFTDIETVRVTQDHTLLITFPPGGAVRYTEIPLDRIVLWRRTALLDALLFTEPLPPAPAQNDRTAAYPIQNGELT